MPDWIADYFERNPEAARLPIAGRTRYSVHLRRAGRQRLGLITGAPMHYYDAARRSWEPFDTTLQVMDNGRLGVPGLPFSLSLDGDIQMDGYSHRHKTWRIGVLANGRFEPALRLGDGKRLADRIVREVGFLKHETIVLPSGLKEQLTLLEKPPLDVKAGGLFATETLLPEVGFPEGWVDEHSRGGLRFPRGWAQDANGVRIPLLCWAAAQGSQQRLYSGVPVEWLDAAAYPLVLDPDIELPGGGGDATIEGNNVTTSVSLDTSSASLSVGGRNFSSLPHVWRAYLKFNTSSLGPSAVVEQANLKLYPTTINSYVTWTIYVRQYNWAATDPLSDANRETAWDGLLAAGNAAVMATSSNPAGTPVTSQPLPTAWIDIEGNTYYGLWNNQEGYAFPANQGGQHQYSSANHGTPGQRPVLMLEYVAGFPRTGPLPLRGSFSVPRIRLPDTRRKLRARPRRVSLHSKAS